MNLIINIFFLFENFYNRISIAKIELNKMFHLKDSDFYPHNFNVDLSSPSTNIKDKKVFSLFC